MISRLRVCDEQYYFMGFNDSKQQSRETNEETSPVAGDGKSAETSVRCLICSAVPLLISHVS